MQYIDKVRSMLVVQVSAVRAQCGDSRDPTVAARFFSDHVVDIPVVFNVRCWCRSAENCVGPAVAAHSTRWSISLLAQFNDKI